MHVAVSRQQPFLIPTVRMTAFIAYTNVMVCAISAQGVGFNIVVCFCHSQVVDIGKYNEYEEVIYNSSYPRRLQDITLKLDDSLFIDWDEVMHAYG